MKWIWLTSSLGAGMAVPFDSTEILPVGSVAEALDEARRHTLPRIVLEVTAGDEQRARDLITMIGWSGIVWIYQRSATVAGAVSFVKSGAANVYTSAEELRSAMVSLTSATGKSPARNDTSMACDRNAMRAVSDAVALVAARHCTVLIEGETGTGKEVVAREIHSTGNRSRGPFIPVNCGAIPEALLEAELFGHTRGAFTGAVQPRTGKFEAAQKGTIFLDEIGDMPVSTQTKLLRVLQEREIERLGGNEKVRLDVRVLAATNANLAERVREGRFRQDLYYRLNVFHIVIPPLRQRSTDIPLLAQYFLNAICARENLELKYLDPSAIEKLVQHDWPGNVRELENAVEAAVIRGTARAVIFASDISVGESSAPAPELKSGRMCIPPGGLSYQAAIESLEYDLLTQALARTRGNKTAAADLLQLKRTTLSARLRALELRFPRLVA